jgi:hypothetical protein
MMGLGCFASECPDSRRRRAPDGQAVLRRAEILGIFGFAVL